MGVKSGSPSVRIGVPNERRNLSYAGAEFPIQPGELYVLRGWVHRAGDGSATLSGEVKATKTSTKGSVNMLLTNDKPEAGGAVGI